MPLHVTKLEIKIITFLTALVVLGVIGYAVL